MGEVGDNARHDSLERLFRPGTERVAERDVSAIRHVTLDDYEIER